MCIYEIFLARLEEENIQKSKLILNPEKREDGGRGGGTQSWREGGGEGQS